MTKDKKLFLDWTVEQDELARVEELNRTPKRRHYPETDNEQKGKLRCK